MLEKEMATHSSVLAWRIPGTGVRVWPSSDWWKLSLLASSTNKAVAATVQREPGKPQFTETSCLEK